jgi:hypothetical protein
LREIFEGESNRMMKTDSHPLLLWRVWKHPKPIVKCV